MILFVDDAIIIEWQYHDKTDQTDQDQTWREILILHQHTKNNSKKIELQQCHAEF